MSGVPAARCSMAEMHSVSTKVFIGLVGMTPISDICMGARLCLSLTPPVKTTFGVPCSRAR
jgi:hypothetical protein